MLSEGYINSQQMDNLQESMTLMITAMARNEEKVQRELEKEDLKKERRALESAQENGRKQKE